MQLGLSWFQTGVPAHILMMIIGYCKASRSAMHSVVTKGQEAQSPSLVDEQLQVMGTFHLLSRQEARMCRSSN